MLNVMHTPKRASLRRLYEIRQTFVKFTAVLLLIPAVLSYSAPGDAQQTASAFRNIVDRVSRSSSLLMLQAVCDAGMAEIKDGIARCTACPSFTSLSGRKSGFSMANVVLGSFTQAREPEALLYMKGCESGVTVDGGIVLLRQTGSGWSRLQYQKRLGFTECLKFRTLENVSNLLCSHSFQAGGNQSGEIFWIDITDNNFSRTTLLRWYDNTGSNPRELVSVFPYRFLRSDFNQDARSDVRIGFHVREQLIPEEYSGALDAINSGYRIDAPRSLSLTYLFNGISLKLHKDSQQDLTTISEILNRHLPAGSP